MNIRIYIRHITKCDTPGLTSETGKGKASSKSKGNSGASRIASVIAQCLVLLPSLNQESTCDWNGRRNLPGARCAGCSICLPPGPFHLASQPSLRRFYLLTIILLLFGIEFCWSQTYISRNPSASTYCDSRASGDSQKHRKHGLIRSPPVGSPGTPHHEKHVLHVQH